MRKALLLTLAFLATFFLQRLDAANTVKVVYSGTTAIVTIDPSISNYVTLMSGTSSHVKLIQSPAFAGANISTSNTTGEITYVLSGTSDDGEFYLEGSFKATVELNGLTLTNPAGPAINIQDGKRIAMSVKKDTKNTLADGVSEEYNGCLHCKGHLELKGKGTLNVTGNSRHGIYSKEYMEVKNLTLNITAAQKDGIHCKEYFLMEGGTVTISGVLDDGIQVEVSDVAAKTGAISDHEDEDSGNFYHEDGTLNISAYGGKAVKADGTIKLTVAKCNFTKDDCAENALADGIISPQVATSSTFSPVTYDLQGRRVATADSRHGLRIVRRGSEAYKLIR